MMGLIPPLDMPLPGKSNPSSSEFTVLHQAALDNVFPCPYFETIQAAAIQYLTNLIEKITHLRLLFLVILGCAKLIFNAN